jgi:hypothetical protein
MGLRTPLFRGNLSGNTYPRITNLAAARRTQRHVPSSITPRVTIVVAFLEPKNTGAAMKEICGTLRTIIQGPGSSSAVAA